MKPYFNIIKDGTVHPIGEFSNVASAWAAAHNQYPGTGNQHVVDKLELAHIVFNGMALLAGVKFQTRDSFLDIFGSIFGAPPAPEGKRKPGKTEITVKLSIPMKDLTRPVIVDALQALYDTGDIAGAFETEMHGDKLGIFLFRELTEDGPFIEKRMNEGIPTREFALASQIRTEFKDAVSSKKWKLERLQVYNAIMEALAEAHKLRIDWPEGV